MASQSNSQIPPPEDLRHIPTAEFVDQEFRKDSEIWVRRYMFGVEVEKTDSILSMSSYAIYTIREDFRLIGYSMPYKRPPGTTMETVQSRELRMVIVHSPMYRRLIDHRLAQIPKGSQIIVNRFSGIHELLCLCVHLSKLEAGHISAAFIHISDISHVDNVRSVLGHLVTRLYIYVSRQLWKPFGAHAQHTDEDVYIFDREDRQAVLPCFTVPEINGHRRRGYEFNGHGRHMLCQRHYMEIGNDEVYDTCRLIGLKPAALLYHFLMMPATVSNLAIEGEISPSMLFQILYEREYRTLRLKMTNPITDQHVAAAFGAMRDTHIERLVLEDMNFQSEYAKGAFLYEFLRAHSLRDVVLRHSSPVADSQWIVRYIPLFASSDINLVMDYLSPAILDETAIRFVKAAIERDKVEKEERTGLMAIRPLDIFDPSNPERSYESMQANRTLLVPRAVGKLSLRVIINRSRHIDYEKYLAGFV